MLGSVRRSSTNLLAIQPVLRMPQRQVNEADIVRFVGFKLSMLGGRSSVAAAGSVQAPDVAAQLH